MNKMASMMQQVQKMQADMKRMQKELENKTVEASSGGGMVKVIFDGKQQLRQIKIEKQVVNPEDLEMLEDLVLAAVNEGLKKSQDMVSSEMSKLTGGLNIPGLNGLM
ncbi:MAG: YbaB/EbfC family nucleoid-associated protein [bacterium]|nr:YbaB/EbfC family nucleoid-associated protein [bacterium]